MNNSIGKRLLVYMAMAPFQPAHEAGMIDCRRGQEKSPHRNLSGNGTASLTSEWFCEEDIRNLTGTVRSHSTFLFLNAIATESEEVTAEAPSAPAAL
jgi:hypothetical protein